LDKLVCRVIDFEEIEADNLMWSQQKCFDAQGHAQFHAAYLRYRNILIPEAKLEYEELHDRLNPCRALQEGVSMRRGGLSLASTLSRLAGVLKSETAYTQLHVHGLMLLDAKSRRRGIVR
jgi:hypothetical protein